MSFEQRLGDLLKDDNGEDPNHWEQAGAAPGPIIARARRRRARRTTGAAAAALAVALVCGATAVTAGSARQAGGMAGAAGAALTPSTGATAAPVPTPTGPPVSPVRQVAAGEALDIIDGFRIRVTATAKCDEERAPDGSWDTAFGWRDTTSDNVAHNTPAIYGQAAGTPARTVLTGFYLGPAPTRITARQGDAEVTATVVAAPGMTGWTAYYAVLPPRTEGPKPSWPGVWLTAYDAAGKVLAADGGANLTPHIPAPTSTPH
ncbi:hypothetical protein OH807_24480 [Kitasatospora sp. NBC_01560]|uniref:hypothetical protein n=1 Tax=Kitasatospora sp. NBC_01560 TaxID=2975965 RepID=UPI0038688AE2